LAEDRCRLLLIVEIAKLQRHRLAACSLIRRCEPVEVGHQSSNQFDRNNCQIACVGKDDCYLSGSIMGQVALVVDDDPAVLELIAKMLEDLVAR